MKQPAVFGSLGSHYTWQTVRTALQCFFQPDDTALEQLTKTLHLEHAGDVYLTYKGRDAVEIALRCLGVSVGDLVMTQAFACSSVEEAIVRVGARPLYVDLQQGALAPAVDTLQAVYQRHVDNGDNVAVIKALLVQGTLGTATNWRTMIDWANSNKIVVIADLAQALGADVQGADAVIYSAGRDKVWDAVSGGAACVLHPRTTFQFAAQNTIGASVSWRVLRYPLLTWLIRKSYDWQIGKVLHRMAVRLGWMQSPIISEFGQPMQPSAALASFMLHQWQAIPEKVSHARTIAQLYHAQLAQFSPFQSQDLEHGSCLRYPVLVDNVEQVVSKLKQQNIHIADRWYRAPVDSGAIQFASEYRVGSCPVAERYARHLINLPTHQRIDAATAERIVALVQPHGEDC